MVPTFSFYSSDKNTHVVHAAEKLGENLLLTIRHHFPVAGPTGLETSNYYAVHVMRQKAVKLNVNGLSIFIRSAGELECFL